MVKSIEPKLRKIGQYLKLDEDTIFTIPEYQRSYSWGIDNCDKLWQDIKDFSEKKEIKDGYFFGTIIINCQEDDTKFSLIDGQQRTTTFLLLLKALLLRINNAIIETSNDEDSESLYSGLKERRRTIMGILYKVEAEDITDIPDIDKDRAICKRTIILENKSINELYKNELCKIIQAVNYDEIAANVEQIKYRQKDNRYTNFFRNFKYFYEKSRELGASQINSFTKALTNNCEVIEIKSWNIEQAIAMFNSLNSDGLPLCDADIISAKLYAQAVQLNKKDEFKAEWEDLSQLINKLEKVKIASIDSILMQQMYCDRAVKKEILTENNNVNVTTPGVRRYFTELHKELLNEPIELCKQMKNIAEIWEKVSKYPVAQVLSKFNENYKLFLASYFYRFDPSDVSEEKIKTILECMLRLFTIMELVDTCYSSKNFKSFLFGEEVKLVDANFSEKTIKTDFDNHIRKMWTKAELEAEIEAYDKNSLVYLNEYLFAKENNSIFALGNKYDIEHIMPNSGKNLQQIRLDAGIESEEEFNSIVNKLGNKILLEETINRSIGNEWFRTKISTTLEDKTGYIDSSYPIAQALVTNYKETCRPFWKKEDIQKATIKAKDRIIHFLFDE